MHDLEKDSLSAAFRLLKEMRNIDREKGYQKLMSEISPNKRKSFTIMQKIAVVAAVLIPALLLLNAYLLFTAPSDQIYIAGHKPSLMKVEAMNGAKVLFTLPDSTSVWLRGGSQLTYDANMLDASERKIEIIGEAYFDVKKDTDKPFIVSLNNLDIKVTGTAFNCNTDFMDQIQVTLVEGQVEMMQKSGRGNVLLSTLAPGDHFQYDAGKNAYNVKQVDVRKYIGWKDNYLLFDNDPMKEVMERLSDWYGVDIVIADKTIENMRFTAMFDDLKLMQIIDILELSSNLKSTYIRGKIDENGKAIEDKLILRVK